MSDAVNSPSHYKDRVPGVECIEVTQHFSFVRGNAIKYLWRAGTKGGPAQELEDLQKARWYIDREIAALAAAQQKAEDQANEDSQARVELHLPQRAA